MFRATNSSETCAADSNRSIKRSINKNCCILLVVYIIVLVVHGLMNVKMRTHVYAARANLKISI